MKLNEYTTWDGQPLKIVYSKTGPPRTRGGQQTMEANVSRTFEPSGALHAAIFNQESGVFNDKTAPGMTLHERTTWLHLWDGVCCRSITPAEAYDAVAYKRVPENLLARASNYMHLI